MTRIALLSCVLFLCIPALSSAQEAVPALPPLKDLPKETQQELLNLVELGEARYKAKDFAKSLEYFQDAYALYPHPRLLFRIASAHDGLDQKESAFEYYERFLHTQQDSADAPTARARAKALRAGFDASLGTLRILSQPRGAVVYIDSDRAKPKGTTPTVELPLAAGEHTVILKKDGYKPLTQTVMVQAGSLTSEQYDLERDRSSRSPSTSSSSRASSADTWLWVMAATAGVGVVSTATFGYLWSKAQGEEDREASNAQAYETLTYVSGGVAVLGIVGTIYFLVDRSQGVRAMQAVVPTVGMQGEVGVSWQGRF